MGVGEIGTLCGRDDEITHFGGDKTMQMHGNFEVCDT